MEIVKWEVVSMGFTSDINLKVVLQLDDQKEPVNFNLKNGVFEIEYFFVTLERAKEFAKFVVNNKIVDLNDKIYDLNEEIVKWKESIKDF